MSAGPCPFSRSATYGLVDRLGASAAPGNVTFLFLGAGSSLKVQL